jgi:hypothetical protein
MDDGVGINMAVVANDGILVNNGKGFNGDIRSDLRGGMDVGKGR